MLYPLEADYRPGIHPMQATRLSLLFRLIPALLPPKPTPTRRFPTWVNPELRPLTAKVSSAPSDTLILDEDGTYDPAHFNDRLLLGLNRPWQQFETSATAAYFFLAAFILAQQRAM
jgi:hypothetical protein